MALTVACSCGQRYSVEERYAGQQVPCTMCGRVLTIPAADTRVQAAPDPWSVSLNEPSSPAVAPRRSGRLGMFIACLIMLLFTGGMTAAVYFFVVNLREEQTAEPSDPPPGFSREPTASAEPPTKAKEEDKEPKTREPASPPSTRASRVKRSLPPPSGEPWRGHISPVVRLSLTSDGRSIWSAAGGLEEKDGRQEVARDSSLRRWDAATGKESGRLEFLDEGLAVVAFSPDGRLAAVTPTEGIAADRGEIQLWDLLTKGKRHTLKGHTKPVSCLAFSANGKRLLSGALDSRLMLWDAATGKPVHELKGHTDAPTHVALSGDGRIAVSGGTDRTVRIWDLVAGKQQHELSGHTDAVSAIALALDGRLAASGSGDLLIVWDTQTGKERQRLKGHSGPVTALAFAPSGQRLLSAGQDGTVRLWQVGTDKEVHPFEGHTGRVLALAFFPDGRRAVSAGEDCVLHVWKMPLELADLVKDLTGDNPAARSEALTELSRRREEARAVLPKLFEALGRKDDALRKQVLDLLRELGPMDKDHVPHLVRLLEDKGFAPGRQFALDALVALGAEARPAAKALLAMLGDPDAGTRRKVLAALTPFVGEVSAEAFKPLLGALADRDSQVRAAAEAALDKLGKVPVEQIPELRRLLSSELAAVRRFGLRALAGLGEQAGKVVPELADRARRDELAELRRDALAALAKVAPADPLSITAALRGLEDRDSGVYRQAAKLLATAKAVSGLLQALGHADALVSKIADDALDGVRYDTTHVKPLTALLASQREAVRRRALEGLDKLGGDAVTAVKALCQLLKTAEGEEQLRVMGTLARIGPGAAAAGPQLAELLKSKDAALRFEVCSVLTKVEAAEVKQAVRVLIEALKPASAEEVEDEEAKKQRERARALLVQAGKHAVKPLATALERDFAGGRGPAALLNAKARLEVIQTLVEIGSPAGGNDILLVLARVEGADRHRLVKLAARDARLKLQRKD